MNKGIQNFFNILEPIIILIVFFIYPFISQIKIGYSVVDFNDINFYIKYFIGFILRFSFVILIIKLNSKYSFKDFGFKKINFYDFKYIIYIFFSLIFATFLFKFVLNFFIPQNIEPSFSCPNKKMLWLTFILFISVGYIEEIIFRAYALVFFNKFNINKYIGLFISTTIFAILHLYQGIIATITIFFIGALLYLWYYKIRNLHILAISHALFNFFQILVYFLSTK